MEQRFWHAAGVGNVDEVKEILAANPSLDVNRVEYDWTPLHSACSKGQDSVVALLLSHPRIDVTLRDADRRTPFMIACENGRTSCVRMMLHDQRVQVNDRNKYDRTSVYLAAFKGHLEVVKLIISLSREAVELEVRSGHEKPENLRFRPKLGESPFDAATRKGHEEVARLLRDFSMNRVLVQERILREYGVEHWPLRAASLPLQADGEGCGRVGESVEQRLYYLSSVGLADEVKMILVEKPALNINWGNEQHQGNTALHIAAASKKPECVGLLLLHSPGIKAGERNDLGENALHLACRVGCVASIRHLLEHPTSDTFFGDIDLNFRSPLWYAASTGNEDAATMIMAFKGEKDPMTDLRLNINRGRARNPRSILPPEEEARHKGFHKLSELLTKFRQTHGEARKRMVADFRTKHGVGLELKRSLGSSSQGSPRKRAATANNFRLNNGLSLDFSTFINADTKWTVNAHQQGFFTDIEKEAIKLISRYSDPRRFIFVAVAWFSNKSILEALLRARAKGTIVAVVIHHDTNMNFENIGSVISSLSLDSRVGSIIDLGGTALTDLSLFRWTVGETVSGLMHHKFMVCGDVDDDTGAPCGQCVWSGSFNFTNLASTTNFENAFITQSPTVANCHIREFARIFCSAKRITCS